MTEEEVISLFSRLEELVQDQVVEVGTSDLLNMTKEFSAEETHLSLVSRLRCAFLRRAISHCCRIISSQLSCTEVRCPAAQSY